MSSIPVTIYRLVYEFNGTYGQFDVQSLIYTMLPTRYIFSCGLNDEVPFDEVLTDNDFFISKIHTSDTLTVYMYVTEKDSARKYMSELLLAAQTEMASRYENLHHNIRLYESDIDAVDQLRILSAPQEPTSQYRQ